MKPDTFLSDDSDDCTPATITTPSADYIHAISEFFDTDPSDLLVELGYYNRAAALPSQEIMAELALSQE